MSEHKPIIFLSGLFPKQQEEEILNDSKGVIQFAANTLQWAILEGLIENNCKMKSLNLPFVGSYPSKYLRKSFLERVFLYANVEIKNVHFSNIILYKFFSRYINLKKELNKIALKNEVLLIYSMNLSFVLAAVQTKRRYKNVKICLIVPDLPQFMNETQNVFYKILKNVEIHYLKKYLKKIDYFVLLTKAMASYLEIENKPWVVVEGIASQTKRVHINRQDEEVVLLYTGTLAKRYGIINLLKAFKEIPNKNFRLFISGDGDGKAEINEAIKVDSRIKYYGQLANSEILKMQSDADILVNPRLPDLEFTKYSFPSKTMEYLSSGTATIMYRLDGVPEEYYPYFFTPDTTSVEDLKSKILEISKFEKSYLTVFGKAAQKFIEDNKNAKIQTEKIINLLNHKYAN